VWLPGLFAADEPPTSEALWSRVSTLLMFGEGVISSSESPAPSALGIPEPGGSETVPGVPETVPGVPEPFRTLRIGERSSPRCWTGSWRLELGVAHGSRLEAALEGGWRIGLAIWQSAREVGGVRVAGPFFLLGEAAGFGFRIGDRARSGVQERSEVRRTEDWSRPDLADPVLFLLALAERVPDGSLPRLAGRVPPSC